VIVEQLQFKLVVTDQLLEQPDVEIMLLQYAKEDVTHNLSQIHVTVLKLLLENVDLDQLLEQPDVEITKLHLAKEDVQHLNLLLHLVTVLLNL
jgi:succinate dehydrogenase flavin-adding protein (antitoxin of CptAB toxin-antitoxin module)